MHFLFRWNWGETTPPVPLTFFRFILVQFDWFVRGFDFCVTGLHSSIYFWVVRLRFVQVGFICVWFDSFLRRSIYFLAVRLIFVQSAFICMRFDLFLRDSIEFLLFWHYLDDLFFYLSAINYVCTRFILFILNWLNMLAVTERQNGLEHLMHLQLLLW